MPTKTSIDPIVWVVGIAITLFCLVGIASFLGWIPIKNNAITEETAQSVVVTPTAKTTSPSRAKTVASTPTAAKSSVCTTCGVVESIQVVTQKGTGSGIGAVSGAVVGGVLGSQVGSGSGKDVATVAGAVGGAYVGNEAEKRIKGVKSYNVNVRLDDGSHRVFTETNPIWEPGDRVKIVNGIIQPY